MQAPHDVSVDAVPATDPSPGAQDGIAECGVHATALKLSENVDPVHGPHDVSEEPEPATDPWPTEQDGDV